MIAIVCNDVSLASTLSLVKRILMIIQIIVPIILILFASIHIIQMVKNPAEKNGTKKIVISFFAAAIVFFIPIILNAVMYMIGEDKNFSSCWNNAGESMILSREYISMDEGNRVSIYHNPEDYESGVPRDDEVNSSTGVSDNLDYGCKSDVVRSQFSCPTLKIVEKHLYDFDATNFYDVINNKYGGDFEKYAKSVGGIFGDYYGKTITGRTEKDFQTAAEYVLGWMYMYGWDSAYIFDHFTKWGQCYHKGYAPDAFYAHGGWKSALNWRPWDSWDEGLKHANDRINRQMDFDNIIAGKARGGVGGYGVICGDPPNFIYSKMGLSGDPILNKAEIRLKDVKVGDLMFFQNKSTGRSHGVVVGEVYSDHIVVYDTGGSYICTMNYKRTIEIPAESSPSADLAAINKLYEPGLAARWDITRYADFS